MAKGQAQEGRVPLTAADMARFSRNARAALDERGTGFLIEQAGVGAELVLMGAIPILGMTAFGWSGAELLVFLVLATCVSILVDGVKLAVLWWPIHAEAERFADRRHAWAVVQALRSNEPTISADDRQSFLPTVGIFIDVVFGGVGAGVLILFLLEDKDQAFREILSNPSLLYSLIGLATLQVVFLVWEVVDHWLLSGGTRAVKFVAGHRGVGLFLLLFLAMILLESWKQDASVLVGAVSVLFILMGSLNTLGIVLMRREVAWLRDYLSREAAPIATDE